MDNPPGTNSDLGTDQGRQGVSKHTWETAVEAGTRSGAQIQVAEAGRWWVVEYSKWTMIHSMRRCGERVKESDETTLKATDRRKYKEEEQDDPEND